MRTRHGSYPSSSDGITFLVRPKPPSKRRRLYSSSSSSSHHHFPAPNPSPSFDSLHDDLLVSIFASLSSSASSPSDLINAMLVCKRFCVAGAHPLVLARASLSALDVAASKWSDGAHRFLRKCAQSGNAEAAYTLGMIRFYCFNEREAGAKLMAQAAIAPHASALHSLAIIQFNGSGGTRKDKNLKSGASLCAKAAALAHVDAMRELGHCLQDGYGVAKNVAEGRRLLLEANAREAAAAVAASPRVFVETALQLVQSTRGRCIHHHIQYRSAINKLEAAAAMAAAAAAARRGGAASMEAEAARPAAEISQDRHLHLQPSPLALHHPVYRFLQGSGCSLLSDFGCNVPPPKLHVSNKFLVQWFSSKPPSGGLRLCSHGNCGRPETRRHEFRRCSACGKVNYCSRACQALDWKIRHKAECSPVADWEDREDDDREEALQQQAT